MIRLKLPLEVVSLTEIVEYCDPSWSKLLQSSSDCQSLSASHSVFGLWLVIYGIIDVFGIQRPDLIAPHVSFRVLNEGLTRLEYGSVHSFNFDTFKLPLQFFNC